MSKKDTQKKKKKLSPITWILIVVITIMALLSAFTTVAVGSVTRKNARSNIKIVTDERAKVINDYAEWIEDTLSNFSYAAQITDALQDERDSAKIANLQNYVTTYKESEEDITSLFVVDWNGNIIAASDTENIGADIYGEDVLAELQGKIAAENGGVYNDGTQTLPNTTKAIILMYKGIYDETGKAIGFTGITVYAQNLVNDLAHVQIHGLEEVQYSLIDTSTNQYLYSTDLSLIGANCDIEEVQQLSVDVRGNLKDSTGLVDSKDLFGVGKKTLSAYDYNADYGWILFLTVPERKIYAMAYQLQAFVLIFGILLLILVAVFGIINGHQQAVNRKLGNQVLKNEATKKSLETAMFNDILTEVKNRTSFEVALEKMKVDKNHPCYFAMYDICELSTINAQFSNDAGDAILCNTAQILQKAFPTGKVYRTGDDEFIVSVQKSDNSEFTYKKMLNDIGAAQIELQNPQETPDGTINVVYKVAVTRATEDLSSTIIAVLKDMTKQTGATLPDQVNFLDYDLLGGEEG